MRLLLTRLHAGSIEVKSEGQGNGGSGMGMHAGEGGRWDHEGGWEDGGGEGGERHASCACSNSPYFSNEPEIVSDCPCAVGKWKQRLDERARRLFAVHRTKQLHVVLRVHGLIRTHEIRYCRSAHVDIPTSNTYCLTAFASHDVAFDTRGVTQYEP